MVRWQLCSAPLALLGSTRLRSAPLGSARLRPEGVHDLAERHKPSSQTCAMPLADLALQDLEMLKDLHLDRARRRLACTRLAMAVFRAEEEETVAAVRVAGAEGGCRGCRV